RVDAVVELPVDLKLADLFGIAAEAFGARGVVGVALWSIVFEPTPGKQADALGIVERLESIVADLLRQRHVRGDKLILTLPPASGDGLREALLAVEVVRDQLLIHPRTRRDGADSRAS